MHYAVIERESSQRAHEHRAAVAVATPLSILTGQLALRKDAIAESERKVPSPGANRQIARAEPPIQTPSPAAASRRQWVLIKQVGSPGWSIW